MDEEICALHLAAGKICGWEKTCRNPIPGQSLSPGSKPKLQYRNEVDAIKHAMSLNKANAKRHEQKDEDAKENEAYPCFFCKHWHVGRKMSRKELLVLITAADKVSTP